MLNDRANINAQIVGRLFVTARALERVGDIIFSRFGLTVSMYELLLLIAHDVDTTTRMASLSQITLASITHKTKYMEEKGLIQRQINSDDKRVWRFSLTARGQDLLETISEVYDSVTKPLFGQLPEGERRLILSFLTATEDHMRQALQNRSLVVEHVNQLIGKKGIENVLENRATGRARGGEQ